MIKQIGCRFLIKSCTAHNLAALSSNLIKMQIGNERTNQNSPSLKFIVSFGLESAACLPACLAVHFAAVSKFQRRRLAEVKLWDHELDVAQVYATNLLAVHFTLVRTSYNDASQDKKKQTQLGLAWQHTHSDSLAKRAIELFISFYFSFINKRRHLTSES